MRLGAFCACAVATVGLLASQASGHAGRRDGAALTCRPGWTHGLVAGRLTCLKAGLACSAAQPADYARSGLACVNGRLRPAPHSAGTTATKRVATPPGSNRADPVPLGQPGELGNGWTVTVTGVVEDATSVLLGADPKNAPPPFGFQDVMVAISATYHGPAQSSHLTPGTTFHAIGKYDYPYSTSSSFCGILPDPNLDAANPLTFAGGTIAGNAACWMVTLGDVSSLELFYQAPLSDTRVWFALH